MDDELHLPWDRISLEALLKKVASTGETTKVDLKSIFDLSGVQQQGEMLKDVSALANTYSHNYKNHGFIIFGVSQGAIAGTSFSNNEDHLQATVDDLIKKYLRPFITTQVYIFTEQGKQWGAIVVPPTRNAPHVFCNDIHKRYRGDIYVRSGTTTQKAQPEDYARFFRQHLEEHTYEFQQSINDLQREVQSLGTQIKKLKASPSRKPRGTVKEFVHESARPPVSVASEDSSSVTEKINAILAKEEDQITRGLLGEAKRIMGFIESEAIPWAISTADKTQSTEIMTKIEEVSSELWSAIISIVSKDDKGAYDETLIKVFTYLARKIEVPQNMRATDWGKNIRYYPLFVALYLVCILGVAYKRDKLLRRILKINLQGRSHYDEPLPITYILFMIRNAAEPFQAVYEAFPQKRWCDPIASYTRSLVDRILTPDDPLWDKESAFFLGEFLLCISPMDFVEKTTKKPMIGHPSSGLFLFINSAEPVIGRFLQTEKDWLKKVFERPLEEIFSEFDENAHKLANSGGCWGSGFERGALQAAFPEKAKKAEAV